MGLGSKLKRIAKKTEATIKSTAKSAGNVVTGTLKGESATQVLKDAGSVYGNIVRLGTGQGAVITSGDGQRALSNNTLNKVTLGTTKDIRNIGQGVNQASQKQTVNSSFYKSGFSLGAKVAVGGYVASSYATQLNAAQSKAYAKVGATKAKVAATWAKIGTTGQVGVGAAAASGNFKKAAKKLGVPDKLADKLSDGKKDGGGGGSPGYSKDPTNTQISETKTDTTLLTVVGILGAVLLS